jgi:putative spermidine/putrescine transport system ATP-binding protein
VGTLNVVSAKVLDATAGMLEAAGQPIRAAGPISGGHPGDAVTMALRPEIISLGAREGMNQLSGVVDDVTFLGSIVRVRIRFTDNSGAISFDTFNNPHLAVPDRGTAITISFPPEACLVLDRAEIAAAAAPEDPDTA